MLAQMTTTDWISAVAAATSALAAVAIFWVTRAYTRSTRQIARANATMAEANQQMVHANDAMVSANEAMIVEMREDRRLARRQASEAAAQRLQHAAASTHRRMQRAVWKARDLTVPLEPGQREGINEVVHDWMEATARDEGPIQSDVVCQEIRRFSRILRVAAAEWQVVLAEIGRIHGQQEEDLRTKGDNRTHRMNFAYNALRDTLAEYTKGNDPDEPRLPKDAWDFWIMPSREWRETFDQ